MCDRIHKLRQKFTIKRVTLPLKLKINYQKNLITIKYVCSGLAMISMFYLVNMLPLSLKNDPKLAKKCDFSTKTPKKYLSGAKFC